eukprot:s1023_g15.t1
MVYMVKHDANGQAHHHADSWLQPTWAARKRARSDRNLLGDVRIIQAVADFLRDNTAKILVQSAKDRGSRDNILAMVLFF